MSEILSQDRPIYEDDRIIVYKIPKSNSLEPFLALGSGWHIFDYENNVRATMKTSEILVINPTNSEMNVTLNIVLSSIENKKTMAISMNNEKLSTVEIPTSPINMNIKLVLVPGVNVVTLDTNEFQLYQINIMKKPMTVSFNVQSISIINQP